MHEEIEYAEMLEIPVSTVNVVKRRLKRSKPQTSLEQSLIEQVNERVSPEEIKTEEVAPSTIEQTTNFATTLIQDQPAPDTPWKKWRRAWRFSNPFSKKSPLEKDAPAPSRAERLVYRIEFACAGALCLGIFLTNVFMPQSAINTFFRSMTSSQTTEDTRVFSDFTLTSIVGEYSKAVVSVSPSGVVSFTAEGCVYPAVDGVVTDVLSSGGQYIVKIEHSPTFTSVLEGVDYVYYSIGDEVKHNVPIAYSKGEGVVQMTMYSSGELLDCLQIDDENCLAWVETN